MKIRVADYIANFLAEQGVNHVFTITGGGAMHLNDAFGHHSSLKCVYNHHEQGCAIAAEAYARYSNRIAAVCVTSGPGGTNAITGVLGGWLDSIPMFVVSGQVKFMTTIKSTDLPLRQLGDQEFNITDCVRSMTKYTHMIIDPKEIAYHLEKAYYLATHGRPGPVWLDIPLDVQGATIETEELRHFDPAECAQEVPEKPSKETIQAILEKIKEAKRPVVFAGSAIRLSDSHAAFIELIEKLSIPVVTAWNAHDVLWDTHSLYAGRPGTIGNRGGNFVVQNSDLLLVLGSRLNIRQISYNWENFAKDAYKIAIDIDQAELQKPTVQIDMPIHADLKEVIASLNQEHYTPQEHHQRWVEWSREVNRRYPIAQPSFYDPAKPLNPYAFFTELFKELKAEDVVVASNGSACVCSFQSAIIQKGQRLFTNSGCASMGYGLPAALGVAVNDNSGRVICLEGDGSIQMNIQELQTIIHNNLNIKVFWLNNNGYHSIRQTQKNLFVPPMYGVCAENGVSFPSAQKIAQAYGYPYYCVDRIENIDTQLREILSQEGFALVEVVLDPDQFFEPKLSARRLEDGSMISPSLEDMFPFLPEKEMKSIADSIKQN